jgi:hypothetical protein
VRELAPAAARFRISPTPVGIVLCALPLHVVLSVVTDLSPDEAYYLCAARFGPIPDHPPLVVWLLSAFAPLHFLPLELRVRLPAVVLSAATALAVAALAQNLADVEHRNRAAWIAAWLATFLPLPAAGGFVLTPDVPAAIGFVLALAWGGGALYGTRRAIVTSAVVALACLAKVSVAPAALLAGLALAIDRRASGRNRTWAFALLGPLLWLLPILLVSPLLAPSLRFQLAHAFMPTAWSFAGALGALGAAAAGAYLIWSPPVVHAGLRALGGLPRAYVFTTAGFGLLVGASALARTAPPEQSWLLPAALPILVSAAVHLAGATRRRLAVVLLIVTAPTALAMAHAAHPLLPIAERMDPTARLHGWRTSHPPLGAPGIGTYGPAAEACVYRDTCDDISSYIRSLRH